MSVAKEYSDRRNIAKALLDQIGVLDQGVLQDTIIHEHLVQATRHLAVVAELFELRQHYAEGNVLQSEPTD